MILFLTAEMDQLCEFSGLSVRESFNEASSIMWLQKTCICLLRLKSSFGRILKKKIVLMKPNSNDV